jgi:magnesium chelatase family protein
MSNQEIRQFAQLEPAALRMLNLAAGGFNISARAYMRSIKVARTIADLAGSPTIKTEHLTDALSYKPDLSEKAKP